MNKSIWLLVSASALLGAGCIRTHRTEEVFAPVPASVAVPSSGRTVERVYSTPPETPPPVIEETPPAPPVTTTPEPSTESSEASPTDVQLGQSIRQILTGEPGTVSGNRVEATVQDGVVTLRGSVPTVAERDEIVARVSHLPGVLRVKNEMAVDLR